MMRAGNLAELDVQHLLEEIEEMGRSEESELLSRFEILLIHLLKWRFQPARRDRSRQLSIAEQRRKIERRLKKSPSLRHKLPEILADAYGDAVLGAERETGLDGKVFPQHNPWSYEQMMDPDFYPEA
ncbi:MAG: DUF29 domain-containing protein [Lautropia sp.]|nr:DUF29 domain-containing protein [Lautropia sp.]